MEGGEGDGKESSPFFFFFRSLPSPLFASLGHFFGLFTREFRALSRIFKRNYVI